MGHLIQSQLLQVHNQQFGVLFVHRFYTRFVLMCSNSISQLQLQHLGEIHHETKQPFTLDGQRLYHQVLHLLGPLLEVHISWLDVSFLDITKCSLGTVLPFLFLLCLYHPISIQNTISCTSPKEIGKEPTTYRLNHATIHFTWQAQLSCVFHEISIRDC